MRMKQIRDANDLGVFKDILDLQVVDGNVEAIVLRLGAEGEHSIRIVANDSYSKRLSILTEEFIEEDRFRVQGCFMGLVDVNEVFKEQWEAEEYLNKFQQKVGYSDESGLVIEPFKVLVSGTKI